MHAPPPPHTLLSVTWAAHPLCDPALTGIATTHVANCVLAHPPTQPPPLLRLLLLPIPLLLMQPLWSKHQQSVDEEETILRFAQAVHRGGAARVAANGGLKPKGRPLPMKPKGR